MELEENLCHAYDVYETPRSYYINEAGMAFLFDPVLPAINVTTAWIDEKIHEQNPHSFKALARWGDMKVNYWGKLKKTVRLWYIANLRETFEPLYRNIGLSWAADADSLDFRKAKPMLRLNRQILLIVAVIGTIGQYLWDFVSERMKTPE